MQQARVTREPDAPRHADVCREINERIRLYSLDDGAVGGWICECESVDCFETLALTTAEYRSVRAHLGRYLVAPDAQHVDHRTDAVVERKDGYWVVEQTGTVAAPADSLIAAEPTS